jgi:hypothetical protein
MSRRIIDLTEQHFGRWLVLEIHPKRANGGQVQWLCRCTCDTERVVLGGELRRGGSTSCGCFQREQLAKRVTKHGLSGTRVYHAYQNILQRCRNPNSRAYSWYGARGIDIECSFEEFFADVGHPLPGQSIDRIDNDGNYKVGNLQWATPSMQRANQRPPKRKARRAKLVDIQAFAASLTRAAFASTQGEQQ